MHNRHIPILIPSGFHGSLGATAAFLIFFVFVVVIIVVTDRGQIYNVASFPGSSVTPRSGAERRRSSPWPTSPRRSVGRQVVIHGRQLDNCPVETLVRHERPHVEVVLLLRILLPLGRTCMLCVFNNCELISALEVLTRLVSYKRIEYAYTNRSLWANIRYL